MEIEIYIRIWLFPLEYYLKCDLLESLWQILQAFPGQNVAS